MKDWVSLLFWWKRDRITIHFRAVFWFNQKAISTSARTTQYLVQIRESTVELFRPFFKVEFFWCYRLNWFWLIFSECPCSAGQCNTERYMNVNDSIINWTSVINFLLITKACHVELSCWNVILVDQSELVTCIIHMLWSLCLHLWFVSEFFKCIWNIFTRIDQTLKNLAWSVQCCNV